MKDPSAWMAASDEKQLRMDSGFFGQTPRTMKGMASLPLQRRRMSFALLVPAASVAASFTGCGGSTDSLAQEEQDVLDVVHSLDVDDPAICSRVTPALMTKIFGSREACLAVASNSTGADDGVPSLQDQTVAIDGQTAVVTGTASDGEFTFGLVKRGDEWKLATFARDPAGP